jgi:hypothetical protein
MKLTAPSFFLGLCLAILAVAASPAYAQTFSTTAFSAFHVENPQKPDQYTCLSEDNGAVVNNCTKPVGVNLEFNLPIESPGVKNVTVQDYWAGTDAQNTFYCQTYAYTGTEGSSTLGTIINFTAPLQKLTSTVDVANAGMSIQLICWGVPKGGAVANLNWTP